MSKLLSRKETMKIIGERLREARKNKGFTQQELASRIKGQSKTQICAYENGRRDIPRDLVVEFANVLDVSPVYLTAYDKSIALMQSNESEGHLPSNIVPLKKEFKKGYLVGDIACGSPINQEECEEILIPYNADIALYCKGDSMINASINDGDIVFIKYMDWFDEMINGKIVAVGIGDDYEYTLKRQFYNETRRTLKLIPENDSYKPMIFVGEQLANIHLLGVAVGFTSVL
ncbi:MAG: helix-turn-helix domain-containing protein [Lachnospiraceae bacterium]|nr:helix-turn-helix domain-containing protein [Lachnospiraceae bacterium]